MYPGIKILLYRKFELERNIHIHIHIKKLGNESQIAMKWFHENNMIVNPGKFQAVIIDRLGKMRYRRQIHKISYTFIPYCTKNEVFRQGFRQ